MRLKIRDQLSIFVLATTLTSIGVLAVITWVNNVHLVTNLRSQRLAVIASLKSDQIASDLKFLENAVAGVASRAILINGIKRYLNGNDTIQNWNNSLADLGLVMTTQNYILHMAVFNANMTMRLLNITSPYAELNKDYDGFTDINDSNHNLIAYNSLDGNTGFPDSLFINKPTESRVLLGPVTSNINGSTQIASFTVPIYNNTTIGSPSHTVIGILTVVVNTSSLHDTLKFQEGLGGATGEVLLFGAASGNLPNRSKGWPGSTDWKYIVPPKVVGKVGAGGGWWDIVKDHVNVTWSTISTTNPATGQHVAVGFSNVNYSLCDWLVVVQQDYGEVSEPIRHLRNILLAAVFGTAAGIVAVTCILATFAVRPIARLKDATEKTTRPPGYTPTASDSDDDEDGEADRAEGGGLATAVASSTRKQRNWWRPWVAEEKVRRRRRGPVNEGDRFRIPGKVADGKHFVTDELTDLTQTFNDMTDELLKQYLHLEERVALRTAELREQTRLANAANEAKSMFIANVTHELRTPLNGILGMCSVIMAEADVPSSVKKSLSTIYKSGDLLLCLLTDLLTFSRNQVAGINVVLEEKDFRARELVPQVKAIFSKQAREKGVELGIEIVEDGGTEHSTEPSIHSVLRGDMNRILQVIINLLSNALKFTPEKGSVQLRMCMVPGSDIPIIRPEPPLSTPSTINAPRTAIINPNSPANQAILQEKAASGGITKAGDAAASLAGTTPGQVSDSSRVAAAYFDPAHHHHSGERTSLDVIRQEAEAAQASVILRMFEFSVIDTGMGIPANMYSQIFEPFVQGDLGLSKKYGGTGLGLSICKQLAELMGGVIELKSFEGAGSTFTLRIPLKVAGQYGLDGEGNTRAGSLATTRLSKARDAQSVRSVVSTAFSSISVPVAQVQDSTRLVGLSQPFFAPEMAGDDDFERIPHAPPPPPPPHLAHPGPPYAPGYSPRVSRAERTGSIDKTATPPTLSLPEIHVERSTTTPAVAAGATVSGESSGTTQTSPQKGKAVSNPKAEGKKGHAGRSTKSEPIRVLLVEDNKVNQTVVKKLLKLEDVSDVELAEDGLKAVDRIKEAMQAKKKYEIIFMDVQMPNLDGIEATRKIREMGYQAPIVALTAFAEEENVQKCFDSGMDYFLSKPIRRPQLKEVLKTYCKPISEE